MYVSCYLIAEFCSCAFGSLFYMAPRALTSDVVIMATVFMRMVEDYTKPHIYNEPPDTSVGINIYAP